MLGEILHILTNWYEPPHGHGTFVNINPNRTYGRGF